MSIIARATLLLIFLTAPIAARAVSPGERLTYVVGCVNCHHQTPKDIINAPPLVVVKTYSYPEFVKLLRTGNTRTGRELTKTSSIMGIVAVEQFSHMTDAEIRSIYDFLSREWAAERGLTEEKKIPALYKLPPVSTK